MVMSGKGTIYTVGDHGIVASGNAPAVCTSIGLGLADCKNCTKTIIVDINGPHTENATTVDKKDPTCTEGGYYHYTCLNCGENVKDELNNPDKYKATGHKYSYYVSTQPTTTTAGELVGTCKTCGDTITVELPVLSSKDYAVTAATCTVKATYTWNNKNYGVFVFEDKDAVVSGHTETTVIKTYTEVTTNEDGKKVTTTYKLYYCAVCGNNISKIVSQTIED